jgi:signal transduction histidine kinase
VLARGGSIRVAIEEDETRMIRLAPWRGAVVDLARIPRGTVLSRFATPQGARRFWLALLGITALAAELAALRPVLDADGPRGPAIVFNLVGGSFAACGLIAWRRRPDSRSGPLMTATGFAFFVPVLLAQLDSPVASTTGDLLADLWVLFFTALLLTFLSGGRIRSRVDGLLVGAFAFPALVLELLYLQFHEEEGNLLAVFPHAGVADAIDKTQRLTLVGACLATGVVVAVRWRTASAPRRRALAPSVAGAICLVLFAALLVNDLVSGSRSEPLLWLAACSIVTVPIVFLVGLLRSRLARSGLAELLRELRTMRGPELQAALRRALGDPHLTVADAGARAAAPGADRNVVPIERGGREIATLVYDAALDDDPELVEAVCAAAEMAIAQEDMVSEAEARLAELRASRERIVAAGDTERRRLERNLHDGAQQRLVAAAMQLRLLENRMAGDPALAQQLTAVRDELVRSLDELRELARGIHPAVLEHGLESALESLASRSPVPAQVSYETTERLPRPVELAAYFVVSEALANVAKYAAASRVDVRVRRSGRCAVVEIRDDGVGGADPAEGSGLPGLADRDEALDGELSVVSPRGGGTIVVAELPCE